MDRQEKSSLSKASFEALKCISADCQRNLRTVFISGNFNIIHPGHLRLLRFAKECGDYLVVGVYSDNLERGAIINQNERLQGLLSNSWVDYAFILSDQPENFILEFKPKIVVKGKEHEDKDNKELYATDSYGGKLLFSSGDVTFSSIDLLRRESTHLDLSAIEKNREFLSRHNISNSDLINILNRMSKLNVIVIGDIIVDEYITCDPIGMSMEEPTIVVTPILKERYVGGAGIVAAHAKGLGADIDFFTITGIDDTAEFAIKQLKLYGVKTHLYNDNSRPTPLKQRFRANGKSLLRVNHLRQHGINTELQERILSEFLPVLDKADLLIFADFNYGCLPQQLVERIITECTARGIMMTADSQSSSQIGDISRFKGMALLTPTERETRLAVHDFNSGLVILAESLRKLSNANNIFLTLGGEGLLIHAKTSKKNRWMTDRLPAMNSAPKDVAGAGDSLLSCTSLALALGATIWESAYIGSLAAAFQVGKIGNNLISYKDLIDEIKN